MTEHHCNLHKNRLQEDSVPIVYGTFVPESEQAKAKRISTYPFANTIVKGPCWSEDRTREDVLFCPACREAWRETPEGRREAEYFAGYFAQKQPSLEQEIERLKLQQDGNRRYKRIHRLVRIASFVLLGGAITTVACYFLSYNLAFGAILGGIGGVITSAITIRPMA